MSTGVTLGGTRYVLSGDRLCIIQSGDRVLDVSLRPVFDGDRVDMGAWRRVGEDHFAASLGPYGTAVICAQHGRLAYWIETPVPQFETVTYLSDGAISGGLWRTFVSDEYERVWDTSIDTSIPISSAYAASNSPDGTGGGGMTDPDDIPTHWIWDVHVRAFAFEGTRRWCGVSVPGPWGIGVTRLMMHRARFSLEFEVLRAGCTAGRMPVLYFAPDLADDMAILEEHRDLSEKLGLMDLEPKEPPGWHRNPWFGYYDEMQRQRHEQLITPASTNVAELLDDWVRKVRTSCDHGEFNINLEQGCYRLYGDYRPAEVMGSPAHVRSIVDAWRAEGIRAGHYIHPFVVNTKLDFYRQHPETFCKPKDPDFYMDYPLEPWDADDPRFAPIDWTHPLGRAFILDQVEYLLSAADGCMNYDILRSNHWRSPDPRAYEFHDPDWGIGDMMTFKAQKLIYERAKAVKPDCMVTKVAALDCYMQPTYDAMQITEDWTPSTEHWYRRSQLAGMLLKNTLFWIDAWFCTRTKWNEYFMSMMACTIPETTGVDYATHPYYPKWRKLEKRHYNRRKAGIHAYLHAPVAPSDDSRVLWKDGSLEGIYRVKTEGPLAGWYGAMAPAPRSLVTYDTEYAMVVSSETRLLWIPLPPSARLDRVTRVFHDGREEEYAHVYDAVEHRVQIYVEDSGDEVFCYRLEYMWTQERT